MEEKKQPQKIGILTCLHSNDVCARVSCLESFAEKKDFFKEYDETARLAAFMTCNGCRGERPAEPGEDPGILEKLNRLVSENIGCVHVGVCRMQRNGQECGRITQICELMEERGIRVVRGTHRE